ncbi:MAG: TIGR02587 family membrane protein [Pseudomonadota bacterium]|nr:TIGR02587 family membrane protein [Pseudomonadota bacterium]
MPDQASKEYARGLARAFGGALIFGFPILMTMEMWWLGFYMSRFRLALFLALTIPILVGLSHFAGFEKTFRWRDDAMDALAAFAVGFIASAAMLALFGVLTFDMSLGEIIGKVAVQSVPASIGAMLARKQLGSREDPEEEQKKEASYAGELFLMVAGALFVAFNVAPTEEMILIAFRMTPWHALMLALVSMAVLHVLVYTVGFAGQEAWPQNGGFWSVFLRFTVAGYGIALLISFYILWTFGRIDDTAVLQIAMTTVVLGFPSALGAAMARLVV